MTDRYENIRRALEPDARYGRGVRAAYIAACDPDTIRELLAERDQLAAALEAAREDASEAKQNGYELGLLAASQGAARGDGWQPIETAPRDGTRVLLWYKWHDLPVVGEFRHGRWWSVHSLGGNLAYKQGMDLEEVLRPTHWRPLPAPPAIDQARGEAGQEVGNG